MDKVFIYTIADPLTGLVRYVGKTKNTKERFRKHLTANGNCYKSKWIKGLKSKGLVPLFEIIDECEESEWAAKERFYIRLFKSVGAKLLNMMPGGEGGATMKGRTLTTEQRLKITNSKLGKPNKGAAISNKVNKGSKIDQYDLTGKFIKSFGSIYDAAFAVGRNSRRIQAMVSTGHINGKIVNHVGGFKFQIAEGVNNN
jgi:hypothetical protein